MKENISSSLESPTLHLNIVSRNSFSGPELSQSNLALASPTSSKSVVMGTVSPGRSLTLKPQRRSRRGPYMDGSAFANNFARHHITSKSTSTHCVWSISWTTPLSTRAAAQAYGFPRKRDSTSPHPLYRTLRAYKCRCSRGRWTRFSLNAYLGCCLFPGKMYAGISTLCVKGASTIRSVA